MLVDDPFRASMLVDENKDYTLSKWRFSISSGGYIRYLANQMNGCCFDIYRECYHDL